MSHLIQFCVILYRSLETVHKVWLSPVPPLFLSIRWNPQRKRWPLANRLYNVYIYGYLYIFFLKGCISFRIFVAHPTMFFNHSFQAEDASKVSMMHFDQMQFPVVQNWYFCRWEGSRGLGNFISSQCFCNGQSCRTDNWYKKNAWSCNSCVTHVTSALCSRVEIKGTKLVMPLENRQ